jgi:hypothetical protein
VVFVHGLFGDREETWTYHSGQSEINEQQAGHETLMHALDDIIEPTSTPTKKDRFRIFKEVLSYSGKKTAPRSSVQSTSSSPKIASVVQQICSTSRDGRGTPLSSNANDQENDSLGENPWVDEDVDISLRGTSAEVLSVNRPAILADTSESIRSIFDQGQEGKSQERLDLESTVVGQLRTNQLRTNQLRTNQLRTNQLRTKNHASTHIFWPRDLLPKILPDARVFTWGYDVDIDNTISSASTATVFQQALNLLSDLADVRIEEDDKKRPIIFIAHSLGGIVVKDVRRALLSQLAKLCNLQTRGQRSLQ